MFAGCCQQIKTIDGLRQLAHIIAVATGYLGPLGVALGEPVTDFGDRNFNASLCPQPSVPVIRRYGAVFKVSPPKALTWAAKVLKKSCSNR